MDRFRETTVSTTNSNAGRTRSEDLHILDFILPRTFVFEDARIYGIPRAHNGNSGEWKLARWQLHHDFRLEDPFPTIVSNFLANFIRVSFSPLGNKFETQMEMVQDHR